MSQMRKISLNSAYALVSGAYEGSDAAVTKSLNAEIERIGAGGELAANLLRAMKASARAKVYRGSDFRYRAYERKAWAINQVIQVLKDHPEPNIVWGWKPDPECSVPWVLYIELPPGQIRFHCHERGEGPDYAGEWDGIRNVSAQRIILFAAQVLCGESPVLCTEQANAELEQLALAL